jgi:Holliday junction resolvasome RuvABC endonuclease subunit
VTVVLGMDLSLAGSALATRTDVRQLTTKGRKGDGYPERLARLRIVQAWVTDQIDGAAPDLIVIEGPAPNAVQRISVWDRAHLWWHAVDHADAAGIPIAYAPPPNVKKYGTGNGHADKPAMRASARETFPHLAIRNDNDADAAWLCAMGHAWLGAPLMERTAVQNKSLAGVAWPPRPHTVPLAA